MDRYYSRLPTPSLVISAGIVVIGVASGSYSDSPFAILPALFLMVIGLSGVASTVGDRTVDELQLTTKRWWLLAFVAFLPYGFASAPSSEQAASIGALLSSVVPPIVLESVAGGVVLCAVSITVMYGLARQGIHPGRPTPEERILDDRDGQ